MRRMRISRFKMLLAVLAFSLPCCLASFIMAGKSPMKVMKTTNPCGAKKGTFGDAKYSIMWYKKDTSVGIRQRFGEKKQIMSLGGRSTELCEDAMRKIGERVVAKLSSGSSVAECKTFGDDLVQRGYA